MLQKYHTIKPLLIVTFSLFFILNSCSVFEKEKEDDSIVKRERPNPNVLERVDASKNLGNDNRGSVTLFGDRKNQQNAASDNPIWLASIKALEDIPLIQANYSSGMIITDWYSKDSSNESIKINIIFTSSEIKSSSFEVKSFKRTCNETNRCNTIAIKGDFNESIKEKIIENARDIAISSLKKKS
jgi:hypothetical protein